MMITTTSATAAPFIISTHQIESSKQSLYVNCNQGMLKHILQQLSTKYVGVSLECVNDVYILV